MKTAALITILLISSLLSSATGAQDKWQDTDLSIRRLAPSAFQHLPENIARYLQSRGCTVPQLWHDAVPHNVITGEFARKGQTDWAVLCSKNRVSSILVFWRGSTKSVAEIAREPDRIYLQVVDSYGKVGFSRGISGVGKDYILKHYREYGGLKPPPIDHQGIDNGYDEKGSVILYYFRGKWLRLQGAD